MIDDPPRTSLDRCLWVVSVRSAEHLEISEEKYSFVHSYGY